MDPCQTPRRLAYLIQEPRQSCFATKPSPNTMIASTRKRNWCSFDSPNCQQRDETFLLQLCRRSQWTSVIRWCCTHPEEAAPIAMFETRSLEARLRTHREDQRIEGAIADSNESGSISYDTPLGVVCASKVLDVDIVDQVILALISACPSQICASQERLGHTPLRDAILNPQCSHRVLKKLLETDEYFCRTKKSAQSALFMKDSSGLLPLDHIIAAVQLRYSPKSVEMFKVFIDKWSSAKVCKRKIHSPLIRLLSIGASCDSKRSEIDFCGIRESEYNSRLSQILEAAKYLLEKDRSLLHESSQLSGCSALHIALRNFGNQEQMIALLSSQESSDHLMRKRNHYGDLPLHVACSVGVPFHVLKMIVEGTIAATIQSQPADMWSTHSLIWSKNDAGHTPIDLEWFQSIESSQGSDSGRCSYPLEFSGFRYHAFNHNDFYQDLLREAVEYAMQLHDATQQKALALFPKVHSATTTFGPSLGRISLLVSTAGSCILTPPPKTLLHNMCKLSTLVGPTLPLGLVDLYLWMYNAQLTQQDQLGMVPLHYAIAQVTNPLPNHCGINDTKTWKAIVLRLLRASPETSKLTTKDGRLPLHLVLDHQFHHLDDEKESFEFLLEAKESIVQELLRLFPEGVDRQDPITGLYPFQLAATGQTLGLDAVFGLLRYSPLRCRDYHTK